MGQRPRPDKPTIYAVVNAVLDDLLANTQAILGNGLIGLYIDGSLALGDFDPATSDIDFIAATTHTLSATTVGELAAMHRRATLSGRPYASELEGSYIPLRALRRYNPADATHPNIERGPDEVLRPKFHHSDWVIHRHVAREHGLTLFGPPPATLIDPISPDELREATAGVLRSWWATPEAAESIGGGHPGYLAYVAQTMCRALYTLEYGEVVSKPAACRWALKASGEPWQPLIEAAMSGDAAIETDELLRFVDQVHAKSSSVL